MISIEFIEPQEPNKPQPPAFWQTNIRRCFLSWCDDYKPDTVSRLVLGSLVEKNVFGLGEVAEIEKQKYQNETKVK